MRSDTEPLKKPIETEDDSNLQILNEIGEMAKKLYGKQGKRVKSLTRDKFGPVPDL